MISREDLEDPSLNIAAGLHTLRPCIIPSAMLYDKLERHCSLNLGVSNSGTNHGATFLRCLPVSGNRWAESTDDMA